MYYRCRGRTRTGKPPQNAADAPSSARHTVYIFPHTSSWQPHQPTPYDAEPIRTIGLAIRIPYFNRSVCCEVIATIQPSILTTSLGLALLPIYIVCCCVTATVTHQLVMLADSELTSIRPVVLTGWLPSLSTPSALRSLSLPFQLRALHEPRHLSVGHGVITATAYSPPILPLCIQYIQPTCRDCLCASLGVCGR